MEKIIDGYRCVSWILDSTVNFFKNVKTHLAGGLASNFSYHLKECVVYAMFTKKQF